MNKDNYIGIGLIILVLVVILFNKNNLNSRPFAKKTSTSNQNLEEKIKDTQKEVEKLQDKVQSEINKSEYSETISIVRVNKSDTSGKEYIAIKSKNSKKPVLITGWILKSLNSGNSIKIPKSTQLYFSKTINSEEDVYLSSGETAYIITGYSPVGWGFKVNKCSGYLNQFQTFTPSVRNSCPLPEDEDLSSIPKRVENDACFDYIESMSRCKIQTKPLPINWSYECKNFIEKISYASCVDTHKNDSDFYQDEWRIYLKRDNKMWKDKRESIVLYDNLGKIVDTFEY